MKNDQITFGSVTRWLKIKHLVLVSSLAKTRNMHTTAEQMNVTQPAISKLLRDLEDLLGFPLFERQTRNLVLTELGEFVARFARITLEDTESFVDQVNKLRKGGHGHLKLGTIFAATSVVLPEAIASIKRERPLLSIEVIEQTSNHLLEMLEQKKLDLIIARFTDEDCQPFEFTSLGPEPFCLVVNSAHPLCQLEVVPAEAISEWPWVMYPFNTPIRQRMEHAFKTFRIVPPTNTVETISMQTFLQLLQSGPMLAMLPESMVQSQLQNGQLQILNTPFKVESQDYGVITRRDEYLSEPARRFVATLLEFARLRRTATQKKLGNDLVKNQ
ncbi:LysR family transcriptional regulator [Pseudomonas sp. CBS]|uniref:LysR family transcriptional regulator n=1 Tax=Pseudomonas sp. CBS TaxID=2971912 RepID=UPI0021AD0515|nr:LysR family transcriptional regulator [Pseudomonas sp. CBS]UVH54364.1 LysR family transcriptional regulator [Pseudomonas sp. CBS]WEL73806.1 LysR family transcriptional regulator [Pseudomonas sp. CBSPCGW29]